MSVYATVVAIVLIVTIGKVLDSRYRALGKLQAAIKSVDSVRGDQEIAQLKDRIAVLERVITENHGSLGFDREIERLRDR